MTNSLGTSKPTYFTSMSTFAASGFRSIVQTSTEAAPRDLRFVSSHDRVRPESMMSSTMRTCWSLRSVSRSLRIRTTPDDLVPEP